jgi:hypothetical protein
VIDDGWLIISSRGDTVQTLWNTHSTATLEYHVSAQNLRCLMIRGIRASVSYHIPQLEHIVTNLDRIMKKYVSQNHYIYLF